MRIAIPLFAFGLTLQGCIIYDRDCPGCDPDGFDDGLDDRPDRDDDPDCDQPEECDDDTGIDTPPPPDYGFYLTPDEAEQGETFIGSMKADGEDAPTLASIIDVELYGDVAILAADARASEILLTIQIEEQAVPGFVDLLVELDDGTAAWQEGILEIFEAGSGHEAGSSDDGSSPCE